MSEFVVTATTASPEKNTPLINEIKCMKMSEEINTTTAGASRMDKRGRYPEHLVLNVQGPGER